MKVVVTGGRDYADRELVFVVLDRLHKEATITMLIHGACGWNADDPDMSKNEIQGADGHADAWARDRGVPFERVPAAWTSKGRGAGPMRNRVMLEKKPDMVIAFPGGAGTKNCVEQARSRAIPVEVAGRTQADAIRVYEEMCMLPLPSPIRGGDGG